MTAGVPGAAMDAPCRFRVLTPPAPGALAIVELKGDVDAALLRLDMRPLQVGEASLRSLLGVDQGVAVRWSEETVHLMPHGGVEIVRALAERLEARGVPRGAPGSGRVSWPEAADDVESRMLDALSRAESGLAIDLLLDQPRRWRAWNGANPSFDEIDAVSRFLARLIDPPLVAVVGRANVGKSTLTNALARRAVSIVSNEPGTTRDHVGVTLNLAGLAVRWFDTPGLRVGAAADAIERAAVGAAAPVIARADLIVLCADREHGFPQPHEVEIAEPGRVLRVATKVDLGPPAGPATDVQTSAGRPGSNDGLAELVAAIRDRLVPPWALAWPGPWRFDPALAPPP